MGLASSAAAANPSDAKPVRPNTYPISATGPTPPAPIDRSATWDEVQRGLISRMSALSVGTVLSPTASYRITNLRISPNPSASALGGGSPQPLLLEVGATARIPISRETAREIARQNDFILSPSVDFQFPEDVIRKIGEALSDLGDATALVRLSTTSKQNHELLRKEIQSQVAVDIFHPLLASLLTMPPAQEMNELPR